MLKPNLFKLNLINTRRLRRGAVFLSLAATLSFSFYPATVAAAPGSPATITKIPGQSEGLSAQQEEHIKQLQAALEKARKGKGDAEADALYQLGQYYFSIGDRLEAENYLKQSLAAEDRLHRPEQAVQVRVAVAHTMIAQRRTQEALVLYRQALEIAGKNKNSEQAASVLDNMASCMLMAGDFEQAEKLLADSMETAVSPQVKANALINLAAVAAARRDNKLAVERCDKAIEMLQNAEDARTLGLAFKQKGRALANMGDYGGAIAAYSEAVKHFESEAESILEAQVLLSIGQLQLAQRKTGEARENLKKAMDIARSEKDDHLLVSCMIALGAAEADSANFGAARGLHTDAGKLAQAGRNKRLEYLAASEEGFDFLLEGKAEKALDKFLQADSLLQNSAAASASERAGLLRDLGLCYRSLGQMEAAIKYYGEAAAVFKEAGDLEGQALLTNSVAVVHLDMGKRADFEKEFAAARQLASESKNLSVIACLAFNGAQFDFMSQKYDVAMKSYGQAIDAARAAREEKTECMSLCGLGFTQLALKDFEAAKRSFLKAAPIADKLGSLEARWDVALGLAKTFRALGQTADAEAQLNTAVSLVEKERVYLSRDTFKTFSLDLRQECYLELIDLYASSGKADRALELAEKSRARAFLDLLAGRLSRSSADTVALILDGNSAKKESAPAQQLIAMAEPNLLSTVRGVEITPKARSLVESSAYSPVNAAPPSLEEIISLVKRRKSHVVEYCMLKDKVLIWVIAPDGQIQLAPPVVISAVDLKRKISEAHNSIAQAAKLPKDMDAQDKAREALLKELYTLLIAPVQSLLPASSDAVVTFVPHGPLFSVPFSALMSGQGKYLIEERTVSYLPAIGVLRATEKIAAETDRETENTLLAFGNPITKVIAFLGTLPFAEKEVKKIAALFGEGKSKLEVGAQATKSAYKSFSSKYSVLHLATHGLISEERPMDSALVLAPEGGDDGLLTVKDILSMPPLKAKMVVLSACQTGRGKITGDGVVGLSRAFIIAGAPSVVVSQWNVDDVMTEYQMGEFYKSFLGGKSKVAALRDAQLHTIGFMDRLLGSSTGKTAFRPNPRLWAAFQLIGETN